MNNFFMGEQVQDEFEAYLLGLIYADGTLLSNKNKTPKGIKIELAKKDEELLQEIVNLVNDRLNKNYTIKEQINNNREMVVFRFYNKDIAENLLKMGICFRKTYKNDDRVFLSVPEEFKPHFIRGFFDGDGTISTCNLKNKKDNWMPRFQVKITQKTPKLLEAIKNYLQEKIHAGSVSCSLRLQTNFTKTPNIYYVLSLGANKSIINFRELIYKDATIYLKRKYDKMCEVRLNTKKLYHFINKHRKKYQAYGPDKKYLGTFLTIKEALECYNNYVILINSPDKIQEYKGEFLYASELQ